MNSFIKASTARANVPEIIDDSIESNSKTWSSEKIRSVSTIVEISKEAYEAMPEEQKESDDRIYRVMGAPSGIISVTDEIKSGSKAVPTSDAVNGALTDYGNRKKTITLSQKSITTSWGNIATYTVEKTSSLLFQLSMVVGGRNMWTAINIIQKRNETTINQYIKEVYLHNDYGDRITTDWLFNNVQIGDEIIIACACIGSSYTMNSGVIELKYF